MHSQRVLTSAFILSVTLLQTGCAWMLPADPYMNATQEKAIEVPAGLDSPTPDPNLAVPEGETAAKPLEEGHLPPAETTLPEKVAEPKQR